MIGQTFYNELKAAGLAGLPFSWGDDGTITGKENLTPEQKSALDAVIAAHNPNAKLPRTIHPAWLRLALIEINQLDAVNAAVASQGPVKTALWEYATTITENDADVNAIATALGLDLARLFDAAEAIRDARQKT